jgi:TonB-dependent receptor
VFDKELRNYIVTRTTRGSYPGITGIATLATYANVGGAYARGIEASFVDKFRGLPAPLDGFGIDANATYVDAKVDLRGGEGRVELPGTFKFAGNAALFYEQGPVKARVSAQYESKVLFGVGGSRATDVFQDHRFTLDFGGSFDVNTNAQLYLNVKNMTNAPLRFYEGTANRPIQREYYDATIEGGIKLKF